MAKKMSKHQFETTPPHQERYLRGDDDWNLATNACPIDSPKVASHKNDGRVLEHERTVMYPATSNSDSPNIFRSMTDGKGKR